MCVLKQGYGTKPKLTEFAGELRQTSHRSERIEEMSEMAIVGRASHLKKERLIFSQL